MVIELGVVVVIAMLAAWCEIVNSWYFFHFGSYSLCLLCSFGIWVSSFVLDYRGKRIYGLLWVCILDHSFHWICVWTTFSEFVWVLWTHISLFFSTFSINISLCLIHCSIKLFLLMSLLLWISVLSEGLVIGSLGKVWYCGSSKVEIQYLFWAYGDNQSCNVHRLWISIMRWC